MSRPPRTKERRRKLAKQAAEVAELEAVRQSEPPCGACEAGVHDPGYGDDGVCRCRCCNKNMTEEGFPWLNER